jgi:hypothetical protein
MVIEVDDAYRRRAMLLKGVELFAVGTHNDAANTTISQQDLRDILQNYNALNQQGRIAVSIGHDKSITGGDGDPAVGWLMHLYLNPPGTKLLGDIQMVSQGVFDMIRAGNYKFVSIELVKNPVVDNKHYAGYALDGVALLGRTPPAVAGLADLQRLVAARATERSVRFDQALAFSSKISWPKLPKAAPPQTEDIGAELARLRAENAALKASAETQKLEFSKQSEQAAQRIAIDHQRGVLSALETAVRERKILPAVREKLRMAKRLNDVNECLKFSRDDVALYIDAHTLSDDPLSILGQTFAKTKDVTGPEGEEETQVDSLAGRARAIFARGHAPDIFAALNQAVAENPTEMRRILQHDHEVISSVFG